MTRKWRVLTGCLIVGSNIVRAQQAPPPDTAWVNDRVVMRHAFYAGLSENSAKLQKEEKSEFDIRRQITKVVRADSTVAWDLTYVAATTNEKPTPVHLQSFVVGTSDAQVQVLDRSGNQVSAELAGLVKSDLVRWLDSVAPAAPKCVPPLPENVCREMSGVIKWVGTAFVTNGSGSDRREWGLTVTSDGRKMAGVLKLADDAITYELSDRGGSGDVKGTSVDADPESKSIKANTGPVAGIGFVRTEAVVTRTRTAPKP